MQKRRGSLGVRSVCTQVHAHAQKHVQVLVRAHAQVLVRAHVWPRAYPRVRFHSAGAFLHFIPTVRLYSVCPRAFVQ
jgi:hypothetical protein